VGLTLQRLVEVLDRPVSDEQAGRGDRAAEAGVVVAGAGSGKTATMVARVVWLVGTAQVQPDQVLGLTFTTEGRRRAGRAGAARAAQAARGGAAPDGGRPPGTSPRSTGGSAGRRARADGVDLPRLRRPAGP
jgi:DNA helicase-2/ATP-dependent DNA helicase PcrA